MLKYVETLVTFTEVPDEISLCLNISNCPCRCYHCFEPWLAQDIGELLTLEEMLNLIDRHQGISCVCFMGGDGDHEELYNLCNKLKRLYPQLKLAMYSGRDEMDPLLASVLDYYKIGPFVQEKGPLSFKTTNQIFYKKENNQWADITYKFQNKKE